MTTPSTDNAASFARGESIVYTQTYGRGALKATYNAEYVQPSRNREGFSVVVIKAGNFARYRALVPTRDLSRPERKEPTSC